MGHHLSERVNTRRARDDEERHSGRGETTRRPTASPAAMMSISPFWWRSTSA